MILHGESCLKLYYNTVNIVILVPPIFVLFAGSLRLSEKNQHTFEKFERRAEKVPPLSLYYTVVTQYMRPFPLHAYYVATTYTTHACECTSVKTQSKPFDYIYV